MGRFLTTWRLRTYPRLLLIVLFLPVTILILTGDGATTISGWLGGDFAAFYSAGAVVRDGDMQQLYDLERLTAAQAGITAPGDLTLRFAYPPFVAHAYSVLARIPYRGAYAVHTAIMFACLAGSMVMLGDLLPVVRRWRLEAFTLAGLFYPLYRAITGGQNSALTLLLLVAVYRSLAEDRPVLTGALSGLLLYKPQFAIPVIGLLVLRNWRAGIGFTFTAAAVWLWGAVVFGANWVSWWLGNVADVWGLSALSGVPDAGSKPCSSCPTFNDVDTVANGANSVNYLGFAERVFGTGSTPAYLFGGTLALLTTAGLMWIWRRADLSLDLKIGGLACGLVLIPPHVMFYDAGLLLVPMAVLVSRHGRSAINRLVLLVVLGLAAGFALQIGFSTLFPAALLLLWCNTADIRSEINGSVQPQVLPAMDSATLR